MLTPTPAVSSPPTNAFRFFHDADGRLKAAIDPEGDTAVYNWDATGNLLSIFRHASSKLAVVQLSPAHGEVGATVTIEGTGFSTTPASNTVKFNGTAATVSAASATALTVKVPGGATTGAVTVSVGEEGPAASPESFTVAESTAPKISSTSPTLATSGEEVTVSGSNFDANAHNDVLTLNQTRVEPSSAAVGALHFTVPGSTLGGHVSVATAEGRSVGPDLFIPPSGIATSKVGSTGRFSLGDSRSVEFAGSEKVTLLLFDGEAGQKASFDLSEATIAGTLSVWSPSGTQLSSTSFAKGSTFIPATTLPKTGSYTVMFTPSGSGAGSLHLASYGFRDATGTIDPSEKGDSTTATIAYPGQTAAITFSGTKGERVLFEFSEVTMAGFVGIHNPAGSAFSGSEASVPKGSTTVVEPVALPETGTYTIFFVAKSNNGETGGAKVTGFAPPADVTGSITPTTTAEGAKKSVTLAAPGQNARYSVEVKAGEAVSAKTSSSTFSGTYALEWLNPSGSVVASTSWSGTASGYWKRQEFSSAGTYTLVVNPQGTATGAVDLTLWNATTVDAGSIVPSAEGASKTLSVNVPGGVTTAEFEGTAGERVLLEFSEINFSGFASVKSPKGSSFTGSEAALPKSGSKVLEMTLPETGTYTILFVAQFNTGETGGAKATAFAPPADVTGSVTPTTTAEGATVSPSLSPGQNARYSVEVKAGEAVSAKTSSSTFKGTYALEWLNPSGGLIERQTWSGTASGYWGRHEFAGAGTYTLVVNPEGVATGSVTAALWNSTIASAGSVTPTTEGESKTLSVNVPGGVTEATFEGTSGQKLRFDFSEITFSGYVAIHNPKGSGFIGSEGALSKGGTKTLEMTLPETGTYTLFFVAQSNNGETGSAKLTAFLKSGIAWFAPLQTTTELVSFDHLTGPDSFSDGPAPAGTAALAGQVLATDGQPIAGVWVSLEDSSASAKTDKAGRFLLEGAPAGRQILVVDGETAAGQQRYGSYESQVELTEHKTTQLDYTVWLTPLDKEGDQRIASPTTGETRLTTPRIPGLEVRIPAGTVIHDAAGHVVRKLNLTPIPVDRPPFPLPPFVSVPVYFTVQPGRAYLSKGARVVYPNWSHLPPGQRVDFWNYDPDERGWYVYGKGTVTPDGKQVMPDPGVRVWEFTGAMITSSPPPPGTYGTDSSGGDPVDLYSGLFTYHKRDLVLPDTVPIVIERTYRPADSNSYSFGTGTSSLYEMRLWSEHNYTEADLILPDGRRVHYVRTSAGTGYTDAVYRSTNLPGPFYGSEITWDAAVTGWDLKLTSGLTYVFGENAPLQAIRDKYGNTLTLTRSEGQKGNITKITSPHGRWVKFSYDGSNRITEITDNGGRQLKYAYTSGRLTSATDPAGHKTEYAYNGSGQMTSVTDARGNKYLEVAYDANGRVEKQTAADGASFEFSYALNGEGKAEATTLTDPRGSTKEVSFNSEGRTIGETFEPGTEYEETTSFELQFKTGLMLAKTDPLGHKTEYAYDGNGNVTEATQLAGTAEATTTKYAYKPGTDWSTEEVDPLGHSTKFEYGAKGELLKRTDALGRATNLEYNGEGQLAAITNALGQTTHFAYSSGDLTSTTDPLGRTSTQFVNGLGQVETATTPGGQTTRYAYNPDGQVTGVTSPLGEETGIEYDADGNPVKVTDPRGGETTMGYDVMDRLVKETDPLEHSSEWGYDKAGDVTEAVDRNGKVSTFSYDPLRRLELASYGVSGLSAESSIAYQYDDANRLTYVSDSASGEHAIERDPFGRVESLASPTGTVGYAYDAAGRREAMTLPGLETTHYTYDNANELTGLSRGSESVGLEYDKAGRTTGVTLPDGIKQEYGYDAAGQNTSIAYKHGATKLGGIEYAYDANGQLEAMWGSYARLNLPEALKGAEYDADNELVEREGAELEYDKDGNLLADGANEYSWNARGQLTGISGEASASFGYDPFGRRTSKTLGPTTTDLLYDGANVALESEEGTPTASLLSGLQPDQLFSRTTGAGTDSYLTDRLGSTVALASKSAEVTTSYTYDPFGAPTSGGAESDNPYQFTGRENDTTGLQYNRARFYGFGMDRFISQDPMGFAGSGMNLYWYTNGDPLDFTDPSGECFIVCVPDPLETAENTVSEIGNWVSEAESVLSNVSYFFEHNWDTIVAGTATVIVGGTTVVLVTACIGATDGIESVDCIKAASPGIAATVGGVYVTIETTRN